MRRRPLLCLCFIVACVEVSTVDSRPSTKADAPVVPAAELPGAAELRQAAQPREAVPPRAPSAPSDAGQPDADAQPAGGQDEFPSPAVKTRLPDGVQVLDPGSEPKQRLRLSPRKGHKQSVTLSMQMRVAMEVGTQQVPPTPIPAITVVMDTEVEKLAPAIVYRFETTEARRAEVEGGSSRVGQAVDEAVKSLAAAKGTITLTHAGAVQGVELEIADLSARGMKPAIQGFRQSFSQLFPTFPEDPVGIGAKWKAVTRFESDGLQIQQVTTYELVRREGSDVELKVKFDQWATTGAHRDLAGAKMEVGSFAGVGEGRIEQRLDAVAPKKGRAQSRSASQSKVDMGGGAQPLALKTHLELALSAVEAAG